MKDNILPPNLGAIAKSDYDPVLYARTIRDIEMYLNLLRSKGPVTVSELLADSIEVTGDIEVGGEITGDVTGDTTGSHNGPVGDVTPDTGDFTTLTSTISVISAGTPTLTFEDTDASSDDYQFYADGNFFGLYADTDDNGSYETGVFDYDSANNDFYLYPPLQLSSGQIAFPASQNTSSDPNTLDDYEEGTWTPTIEFGGGTTGITYSFQNGLYTKIGNICKISGVITLSNKGTSTGVATIEGAPFTAITGGGIQHGGKITEAINFTAGSDGFPFPRMTSGSGSSIQLVFHRTVNDDVVTLVDGNFANNTDIRWSLVYQTG